MAIADVFDALCSKRPYKEPWPIDRILAYMRDQRGRHFDPALLDLFFDNLNEVNKIRDSIRDGLKPIGAARGLLPCVLTEHVGNHEKEKAAHQSMPHMVTMTSEST